MVELPISTELVAKLQQLARDKNTSLEVMLSDFIAQNQQVNVVSAETMRQFAEEMENLNLHSGKGIHQAIVRC